MTRDELNQLEAAVKEANPIPRPFDLVDSEESAAVKLLVDEGRLAMTSTVTPDPRPTRPESPGPARRPAWAWAVLAFAAVLATAGLTLLLRGGETTVADVAAPRSERVAIPLGAIQDLTRSGDTVWAWDSAGGLATYRDGAWVSQPSLPGVRDVAGSPDEIAWAIRGGGRGSLWQLEDGVWRQPAEWQKLPDDLEAIAVDPVTGTVWVVGSGGLQRWDGETRTRVVSLEPNHGDIAVTRNGTVWVSDFNPFFPTNVGLARHDEEADAWEEVRPLGGPNRHAVMAPTPDGDLWVWLAEFPATESPEGLAGKTLAYYHADSGEWTIYDEAGTPEGAVQAMTANEDGVWLAVDGPSSEIWQFDGHNWVRHLAHTGTTPWIVDIAAAPDGTIWFLQAEDDGDMATAPLRVLYQLEP